MENIKISTALLSVTDKTGLEEFARKLHSMGIRLVATGKTFEKISAAKIPITKIEDITGFPEMLDGRIKTLHPKIHAGILADKSKKEHMKALQEQGISTIDLVVVNLYQFKETVSKEHVSLADAIENIDIGGPAMLRAAAKNFESAAIVTSPAQYDSIIKELSANNCCISLETRKKLASIAFNETAAYDALISNFLNEQFFGAENFPDKISFSFEKLQSLRYGENWHQKAAFYKQPLAGKAGIATAKQLNGRELSFNNINDANSAIVLAKEFSEPSAVIIKHANPCGVASGESISTAFKKAFECDSKSAFGGVIALNRKCNAITAEQIASFFNEIVIAPAFEERALEILQKKQNLRILLLPEKSNGTSTFFDFRAVEGGALVQTQDYRKLREKDCKIVSKRKPSENEMRDTLFAWKVAKHAKSNAIVLAKGNATIGIGAGQVSRIDSTELAIKKSNGNCNMAVLASDSFFPFSRDNVDIAAQAGISAIIQPGGSKKDEEVIDAANETGTSMVFTGVRQFRHY